MSGSIKSYRGTEKTIVQPKPKKNIKKILLPALGIGALTTVLTLLLIGIASVIGYNSSLEADIFFALGVGFGNFGVTIVRGVRADV